MSETQDETCFERNRRTSNQCRRRDCRHWIAHSGGLNCTLIAAASGPMTLQPIGEIIGVTRMRVCQLEKKILDEIKSDVDLSRAK